MNESMPNKSPQDPTPTPEETEAPQLIEETVVFGDPAAPVNGFTVPFSICTSHQISSIGFGGQNAIAWPLPFTQSGLSLNGIRPISVDITQHQASGYLLKVTAGNPINQESAITLASSLEHHLAFLLNRTNPNPNYGTFFIRMEWEDFVLLHVGDGIHVSDSLSVKMEGTYKPGDDDWARVESSEIMRFYAEGARTSELKSKYFQWFRIIEFLEGSARYRKRMNWEPLFSAAEQKLLYSMAEFFGDERKKNVICDQFTRTKLARHEKLAIFLRTLGITEYFFAGHAHEVDLSDLKKMIQMRNNLFHAGSAFEENLLWHHLFPLVTAIVEKEHKQPLVLE